MNWTPSILIAHGFVLGAVIGTPLYALTIYFGLRSLAEKMSESEAQLWGAFFAAAIGIGGVIYSVWMAAYVGRRREDALATETKKRIILALYAEIFNRAARCGLDARTWQKIIKEGQAVDLLRFRKFRPEPPMIFPSVAEKIGAVPPSVLSAVLMFYYRLNAIGRDVDREFPADQTYLNVPDKNLFALRLAEALPDARAALLELRRHIPESGDMDGALHQAHQAWLGEVGILEFLKAVSSPH